jgi:hypothetical protein
MKTPETGNLGGESITGARVPILFPDDVKLKTARHRSD